MQMTAKRFVGEVVEISCNCELGPEGDRAVVSALEGPYMSLTFPDRAPDLRIVHTGADYKYLRTYGGTVDWSEADLASWIAKQPLSGLHVHFTAEEIGALPDALEDIRCNMAHHYSWRVRDAAMTAIGKLITATKNATFVMSSCRICVERRGDDFHACIQGNRAVWGHGSSVRAAIGDLMLTHAGTLGLQIDFQGTEDRST